MTPTARSVAALVRATIGAGNASCTTRTAGVILVVVTGNADRTVDREVLARSIAAAAIREGWDASRTGEVLTITAGEPVEQTADEVTDEARSTERTLGHLDRQIAGETHARRLASLRRQRAEAQTRLARLVTDLGSARQAEAAAATEVEELLDTVEARADAEHAADEEQRALDDLLDACGTAGPGGLHLAPSTTPERITCPACLPVVEADVPPTAEERVTVRIRASELRPGDEVVDSLGERQYAAFEVQQVPATFPGGDGFARVWTAIRDQEAGLPPVITVNGRRELLVLRPLSEEGRELLAALDRP
jgi:hypothetical protein